MNLKDSLKLTTWKLVVSLLITLIISKSLWYIWSVTKGCVFDIAYKTTSYQKYLLVSQCGPASLMNVISQYFTIIIIPFILIYFIYSLIQFYKNKNTT